MNDSKRERVRAAADLLDRGASDGRLLLSREADAGQVAAWLRSEADSSLAPDIHAVELARLLLAGGDDGRDPRG